jgi:3-oxoacyl-[acyl-carrier protein] reductase
MLHRNIIDAATQHGGAVELSKVRALVTGGARGMGHTFVAALRDEGAQVFFCDLDPDGVAAASAALGVGGAVADVSREEDVARLFDEAERALGGTVNVLINNAGILRDGLLVKRDRQTGAVSRLSKAHWDAVIAVNLTGPFLCMREFASRLVEHGGGPAVAIQMSSVSRAGNRGQSNYSAAKAGLVADTRVWAQELAPYGIRVGAVAPGFIETPMVASMRPDALQKVIAPVPLQRLGRPEEVWQAVRFVIACDYFTGRVVEVDGGLVL